MTRVLHVTGSLGMGGAEVMAITVARELAPKGFEFDFLVFGDQTGELEVDAETLGCRVLRMEAPRELGVRRFLARLTSLLKAEGPYDVVHSHVNLASGLVLLASRRAGVPVRIAHSHMTSPRPIGVLGMAYDLSARQLIRYSATLWVACGADAGRRLFGKRWSSSGVVVSNGVDTGVFLAASAARLRVRAELGVPDGWLLAGAVARLVDVKNHSFMLGLVARSRDEGSLLSLAVVGDGPLRTSLQEQSRSLGIADRVCFLGLRKDTPELFAAMDMVLMPSLREGLPVSLVEAQASGSPVLVSDTVTREADLGLGLVTYLPLSDPSAWLDALGGVARETDHGRIRRRFAETGYDCSASAQRLAHLYEGSA